MCLILMYYIMKNQDSMKETINNNTLALNALLQKLNTEKEESKND